VKSHADLVNGVWGIREPRDDAPQVAMADLDMVLMPGLAFDRSGNRLGYGAGYYDRLLASALRKPVRVAAAFDCQVVDAVPTGPADQPFHILVTESQLLHISP
jgi:5-formyltetrahydrofolate cyclo-ligase